MYATALNTARNRPSPSLSGTYIGACGNCAERERWERVSPRLALCRACGYVRAAPRTLADAAASSVPEPGLPIPIGALLRERYRIAGVLGRGAHGISYLAHHEFLNHPCVIKALRYATADPTSEAVRRLRAEASVGFRVNHANVVRVLDGDAAAGVWYFVTEYVDGVDLEHVLAAGVRVTWQQALTIAIDAARGLEAIHGADIVHGDVKPANLLLGTDGRVRVADFGVARGVHSPEDDTRNADDFRGTLAYTAPEILADGQSESASADLFALGATLLKLLTGAAPGDGSVYQQLLGGSKPRASWPAEVTADIPSWFRAAIDRLVAADPRERPASAAELIALLENPGQTITRRPEASASERIAGGVAVMPLTNVDGTRGDDWLGHAVADHVGRHLSQQSGAYVVALDHFLQVLDRVRTRRGADGPEALLEAGRLSGAAIIIEGSFHRHDDQIAISARVHRRGSTQIEQIDGVKGSLCSLGELEVTLYRQIAGFLDLPSDAQPQAPRARRSIVPAAEEKFFEAKRTFLRGHYEDAMQFGKAALELDPSFGEAIGFVGVCYARLGRYDEAASFHQQQELLAQEAGNEHLAVEAYANYGSMHYFRGEYEKAREPLMRAAQAAAELGLSAELATIRNNLGFVLLQLGQEADAEQAYRQAIETHRQHGALLALIGPYNGMGHIFRERQQYEDARAYFRRALGLAQEGDDFVNIGIAFMNLGQCALLQGRLGDAKYELAAALNILEQTSFWNGLARVYKFMAEMNTQLTNWPEALRCVDRRIELARRHENDAMEQDGWTQKADILRQAGRQEELDGERTSRSAPRREHVTSAAQRGEKSS